MPTYSDSLRLAISKEVTQGNMAPVVVDTTPAFYNVRTTGEGLSYEISTTISDEISSVSRGVTDNVLTGATVSGDVSFELSDFEAFEMLLASALGSDWSDDPHNTGAAYPAEIGTAAAIYDYDVMTTFTIEKRMKSTALDTGVDTLLYQLFSGCTADTFNLSITPNAIISGSFGFIGMAMTTPDTEAGEVYNDAGVNPVMSAPLVTGIELLTYTTDGTEGSAVGWLSSSCFTGCDITLSNNGRGLVCIGELGNKATALGRIEVGLSGSLYYTSKEPLEALVGQTEYQFRVTCNDSDGNSYQLLFPRVKFATATALASGTNTDVMVEWTMQALVDDFRKYTLAIIRNPAS